MGETSRQLTGKPKGSVEILREGRRNRRREGLDRRERPLGLRTLRTSVPDELGKMRTILRPMQAFLERKEFDSGTTYGRRDFPHGVGH